LSLFILYPYTIDFQFKKAHQMQHKIFSLALLIALVFSCSVQKDFQGAVHEDFNKPDPKHFGFHTGGLGADFTRAFGIESPSEPGTNIMLFRIDPEDRAGAAGDRKSFPTNSPISAPMPRA
jgi:hypothetical protein